MAAGPAGLAPAAAAEADHPVQVALASAEPAAEPLPEPPKPLVVARIDLSDQRMSIYVDERLSYSFAVSTGRGSYRTPTGRWQAEWLSPRHRSRKYDNAPMPWSVFFYRGYAIHGTTEVKRLGQPASHGCIRLHPDNAKIFYQLVDANGRDNTLISVVR
ncbi:MAG: L,D-transpeptidase [Bauldia sp.]